MRRLLGISRGFHEIFEVEGGEGGRLNESRLAWMLGDLG